MRDWVVVNGAKIERSFFDESLAEARKYSWEAKTVTNQDHHHCVICSAAISSGMDSGPAYASTGGWLCHFCYDRFIEG
jgi:hypothetical protein